MPGASRRGSHPCLAVTEQCEHVLEAIDGYKRAVQATRADPLTREDEAREAVLVRGYVYGLGGQAEALADYKRAVVAALPCSREAQMPDDDGAGILGGCRSETGLEWNGLCPTCAARAEQEAAG